MTRNRQEVTSTYPEIAYALQAQQASAFITDGEIVAFDGDRDSFCPLQRRLGVRDSESALRAEVPVYLYVFDVLGGCTTCGRPAAGIRSAASSSSRTRTTTPSASGAAACGRPTPPV